MKFLAWIYACLSFATVAALAVLSATAPEQTSTQAWVRAVIVAATSLLTLRFALSAARRHPRSLLRLRIITVILVVAFGAVLIFLPLPLWMVWEQVACLVVLVALAAMAFAAKANAGR
jgi:hypothetical protein